MFYFINCYCFLGFIHMDCNDYMDYGNDDHCHDNDGNDDGHDDEFYHLVFAGCHAVVAYAIKRIAKQPCRNSKETGYRWLIHTLTGNETKSHDMFRMKPRVFFQLCNVLQHTYGLQHTRQIRLEESVGICLMTLAQGSCNRLVQERFQHSGETIHRHLHKVIKALNLMAMDLIKPSDPTFSEVPKKIRHRQLYWPHFKVLILFVH
jgi:hypothetical protein